MTGFVKLYANCEALEFGLRRAFRPIFDKIKNAKELYEEDVATLRYSYAG